MSTRIQPGRAGRPLGGASIPSGNRARATGRRMELASPTYVIGGFVWMISGDFECICGDSATPDRLPSTPSGPPLSQVPSLGHAWRSSGHREPPLSPASPPDEPRHSSPHFPRPGNLRPQGKQALVRSAGRGVAGGEGGGAPLWDFEGGQTHRGNTPPRNFGSIGGVHASHPAPQTRPWSTALGLS